jgi:hypothetical protein
MTKSPKVQEKDITPGLRKKLKLPKWVDGLQSKIGGVTSYGTIYGYDWKQLGSKRFEADVARVEKAGFICVIISDDDDNYLSAVKGPLSKLTNSQAEALFGTTDFIRADRMD